MDLRQIERHIDRLYAELGALKRELSAQAPAPGADDERAWQDLLAASSELSARWTGPDVIGEIRAQREK